MNASDVRINGRYFQIDLVRRQCSEVIVTERVDDPLRSYFIVRDVDCHAPRIAHPISLFADRESLQTAGVVEVRREKENHRRYIRELCRLEASILAHPPTGDDEDDDTEEYGDPIAKTPVVDVEVLTR